MFLKRPHYTVKKKKKKKKKIPNGKFRKIFHTNFFIVQWWIWQGCNRRVPPPPPPPKKKKKKLFIIFKPHFVSECSKIRLREDERTSKTLEFPGSFSRP